MIRPLPHPNDPGRWSVVAARPEATVWRRERSDPFPVIQFYLLAPPHQPQVLYNEAQALALLEQSAPSPDAAKLDSAAPA